MKKTVSVLCVVFLILSSFLITAVAVTGNTQITVSNMEALPGDTVVAEVSIKNNPGILGAVLSVEYDEGLTLISATSGEAFSALTMTRPGSFSSPCNFTWDGIEINPDDIKDGIILTLTFNVDSNAAPGSSYNIRVTSDDGDIVDTDLNTVSPSFTNGKVQIKSTTAPVSDATAFTVQSVIGEPGASVDVEISITNNPGILGAILSVSYDERLTLTNAQAGSAFSSLSMTKPGSYASPCNFTWDGVDLDESDIRDGSVLVLTFLLPATAAEGDSFNISVSSEEGDIVDADLNAVLAEYHSGQISVPASSQPDSPTFTAESTQGAAGASVDINIRIANNPGILGAILSVSYDEGLTLTAAQGGTAFSALNMTKPGTYKSPCNFTWDGIELSPEDVKDGVVLTLTFRINTNAASGAVYHINISAEDGDIVDENLNPVDAQFIPGSITVSQGHTHLYSQSIVAPSCEEKGYTLYSCTGCGYSYKSDYTDEIGHYYHYTGNYLDYEMTYVCHDCGKQLSTNADAVCALWNESYLNLRPNSIDNRTKTDNSSLLNVVPDGTQDDGIINAKDYALLLRLKEQHGNQ